MFSDIEIVQGTGAIDRPWPYCESFIDNAYFRPNVMRIDAEKYPPLFVTTGGSVDRVHVVVSDGHGGGAERELLDDGMDGDLRAGDGIFTMTGEPFHPPGVDAPFASIAVSIHYEAGADSEFQVLAECGLVGGELPMVQKLSDAAYRTDHVVNLVDDGTLFVLSEPFVDLRATANRFYDYFDDDYGFLTVRSALPVSNRTHGFHLGIRTDVSGIGVPLFDDTPVFGSDGRLRSATFVNFRLLGPLVHELTHNWANFLVPFGGLFWGGHWGVSDVNGVLGGRVIFIDDIGDGQYAIPRNATSLSWGGFYAMIELYLMGLVGPEEVPPHQVLVNPSIVRLDELRGLIVAADRLDTVSIEDIIRVHGERVPSRENAPRDFKMATVVVSDRPRSPIELAYHDRQAEWFGSDNNSIHAFAAATGFRATIDIRLPPSITAVLDDAADAPGLPRAGSELAQNHPNPFNSSTVWRYTLDRAAVTTLGIYAANGQWVRTIPQGRGAAGQYSIQWDGTDDDGRLLASGVYIARLEAGNASVMRKLTLVR